MMNKWWYIYAVLGVAGAVDAAYLTIMHFSINPLECSIFAGCDKVLGSPYASVGGVPVALLGLVYYAALLAGAYLVWKRGIRRYMNPLIVANSTGFFFSLWLVYLQAYVLYAYCQYCLLSALITTGMFIILVFVLRRGSTAGS